MLIIVAFMIGGFILASLLTEDVDDNNGPPDGGLMSPVFEGV